jgi:hypothetical protein
LIDTAIERYRRFMAAGLWVVDTEPIDFDADGNLLDGQNRLSAVVLHAAPVKMLIRWGVSAEVKFSKDTGAARRPGDSLQIAGYVDGNTLAAAAKLIYHYNDSRLASVSNRERAMDRAEMIQFIAADQKIEEATRVARAKRWASPRFLSASERSFLYYFMERTGGADKAAHFFDGLYDVHLGAEVPKSVALLRGRLNAEIGAKAKLTQREKLALCIKSWRAFREGRHSVTFLRWRRDGDQPEPYPEF